jgi:hypothetical protein
MSPLPFLLAVVGAVFGLLASHEQVRQFRLPRIVQVTVDGISAILGALAMWAICAQG